MERRYGKSRKSSLWLIYSGVLGGFLLGMGVIGKAKEDWKENYNPTKINGVATQVGGFIAG